MMENKKHRTASTHQAGADAPAETSSARIALHYAAYGDIRQEPMGQERNNKALRAGITRSVGLRPNSHTQRIAQREVMRPMIRSQAKEREHTSNLGRKRVCFNLQEQSNRPRKQRTISVTAAQGRLDRAEEPTQDTTYREGALNTGIPSAAMQAPRNEACWPAARLLTEAERAQLQSGALIGGDMLGHAIKILQLTYLDAAIAGTRIVSELCAKGWNKVKRQFWTTTDQWDWTNLCYYCFSLDSPFMLLPVHTGPERNGHWSTILRLKPNAGGRIRFIYFDSIHCKNRNDRLRDRVAHHPDNRQADRTLWEGGRTDWHWAQMPEQTSTGNDCGAWMMAVMALVLLQGHKHPDDMMRAQGFRVHIISDEQRLGGNLRCLLQQFITTGSAEHLTQYQLHLQLQLR